MIALAQLELVPNYELAARLLPLLGFERVRSKRKAVMLGWTGLTVR